MKIYPLVDQASNWYPKQALAQFKKYSSLEFIGEPTKADVIWIFSYYVPLDTLLKVPERLITLLRLPAWRRQSLAHTPIVTTIHHLLPSKKFLWQPKINTLKQLTSVWHFPSQKNLLESRSHIRGTTIHLPYWIDTAYFFPLAPSVRGQLRKKYDVPFDKMVFGSFQRDTEADLQQPKLEKGPDVLCDILTKLDRKNIFVVLAGTRRHYVEKRLTEAAIPFKNVGRVPFTELNNLYNMIDYYLVTSRYEGGPQAILEAMATRTKIYSTVVGIAEETLSPLVLFTNAAAAHQKLLRSYPDVIEEHTQKVERFDCRVVIPTYEQFFTKLTKSNPSQRW